MAWRVARSLEKLRDQVDAASPNRNKASDGTIGDADHQNRTSDHNPWCGPGVVTAIDITHDPAKGVDIDKLTDDLQESRDPRIKYVIANRMIMSGNPGPSPWVWRSYSGSNPHTQHFHLSVNCGAGMDDTRPWKLPSLRGIGGSQPVEPTPREDEDMPLTDKEIARIAEAVWSEKLTLWATSNDEAPKNMSAGQQLNQARGYSDLTFRRAGTIARAVRAHEAGQPLDIAELAAELAPLLNHETAKALTDELYRRLEK